MMNDEDEELTSDDRTRVVDIATLAELARQSAEEEPTRRIGPLVAPAREEAPAP